MNSNLILSAPIRDLLLDLARVRHVPGIALRRAVFLRHAQAINDIRAWRRERAHAPPMLTVDVFIHDAVSVALPALHDYGTSRDDLLDLIRSTYESDPAAEYMDHNTDVFLTAAMARDGRLIAALYYRAVKSPFKCMVVIVARMIAVARAHGNDEVVTWLEQSVRHEMTQQRVAIPVSWSTRRNDALAMLTGQSIRTITRLTANDTKKEISGSVPRQTLTTTDVGDVQRIQQTAIRTTSAEKGVVAVLTDHGLMAHVGSFQDDPLAFVASYEQTMALEMPGFRKFKTRERKAGVMVHFAIIHNDFEALKTLHNARRLELGRINYALSKTKASPVSSLDTPSQQQPLPAANLELSFRLAMHVAACEGRLEMLQWLHDASAFHQPQQLADEITCRPETTAMAIRCGWACVVEWLHLHRPESEYSMHLLEYAVNDAAEWGHVDVLRVCHKYGLGQFTSATLARAASSGQLAVIELLQSLGGEVMRIGPAMDCAIQHGHLPVIEYFLDLGTTSVDERHLSLSLQSASNDAVTVLLWSRLDISASPSIVKAVLSAFETVCAERPEQMLTQVLPFVKSHKLTLVAGCHAAIRSERITIVELLLPLLVDDAVSLRQVFQHALRLDNTAIAKLLRESGGLTREDLGEAFRHAVTSGDAGDNLDALRLDKYCTDALPLAVKANRLPMVRHLHPRRTRETAIQALRVARTDRVIIFLLTHEQQYYTKRKVLECLASSFRPRLVRFLLCHGRDLDLDTVADFAGIATQSKGPVTAQEIAQVKSTNDTELIALLASSHCSARVPVPPRCVQPNTNVAEVMAALANVVVLDRDDMAMESRDLSRVETTQHGDGKQRSVKSRNDTYSAHAITNALERNDMDAVQMLLDQQSGRLDDMLLDVLSRDLVASADDSHSSAMALLRLLVHQRPTLHAKLLTLAAGAGSKPAVQLIVDSESSSVDASAIPVLGAVVAAARGGHRDLIETCFQSWLLDVDIRVVQLREQLPGVGDASCLQLLLSLLEQWNPFVRVQLEQERSAASALFGFGSAAATTTARQTSFSSSTSKRVATSKAKRNTRQ